MLKFFFHASLLLLLISCKHSKPLVSTVFMDSLVNNYQPSAAAIAVDKDLDFWKSRMDSLPESFVNQQKYAGALASRFHLYGNIHDLLTADSIMQNLASRYHEPGMFLSLAGLKMQQHQFSKAKAYIDSVIQMKAERYATQIMSFDVNSELGNEFEAARILHANYAPSDYAYNFRLSKQDHLRGDLDSAVAHMMRAAELGQFNPYLKTAALSNAADLYVHNGDLEKATRLYEDCIRFNSCDFHSLMGLAWIALVHDNDVTLAKTIFSFAQTKTLSPEPLLKLAIATEASDSTESKKYAEAFVNAVSDPVYGNMYNKYLIQVYTSILNEPLKALTIAQKEISNRATSQTYTWLAWTLYCCGRKEEAYRVYQNYVSGKALEALELYWMGKMMQGVGKGYNAKQFFKAAEKNKYDLSPVMRKDLERSY